MVFICLEVRGLQSCPLAFTGEPNHSLLPSSKVLSCVVRRACIQYGSDTAADLPRDPCLGVHSGNSPPRLTRDRLSHQGAHLAPDGTWSELGLALGCGSFLGRGWWRSELWPWLSPDCVARPAHIPWTPSFHLGSLCSPQNITSGHPSTRFISVCCSS